MILMKARITNVLVLNLLITSLF